MQRSSWRWTNAAGKDASESKEQVGTTKPDSELALWQPVGGEQRSVRSYLTAAEAAATGEDM